MKKLIAFDLDDTLAVSKSEMSDRMSELLGQLLQDYRVLIISGGRYEQFQKQVISRLDVGGAELENLHLMPACGTQYYIYDIVAGDWKCVYAENLSAEERAKIIETLKQGAKHLGLWEANPTGEIIEDRGSQITFSALGQFAPAELKYKWDPDSSKKIALRDHVAPQLPGFEVRAGGTTSIDITRQGIDKAYGMKRLLSELGYDIADVLFFGDKIIEGGNDYPIKLMGIDTISVEGWEQTAVGLDVLLKT
jgi:phosphomannomutase